MVMMQDTWDVRLWQPHDRRQKHLLTRVLPAQSARAGGFPTAQNDGSAPDKNHCDKTAVGEAVLQIPNAVPVRNLD